MGRDKALLPFLDRLLIDLALEKLHTFCANVSIAGNRNDLTSFAPVICESRLEAGPAAGIEAALHSAQQQWLMFVPVDAPLVPATLLRRWAETVTATGNLATSHLFAGTDQPAFCMLHRDCAHAWTAALDSGERRLARLLESLAPQCGSHQVYPATDLTPERRPDLAAVALWFSNVNTPEELAQAEALALSEAGSSTAGA